MKYSAIVRFNVFDIEAEYPYKAHEQLNKLIDQLVTVDTDLLWDDVDWTLMESDDK